jgi:hypothetical protein
VASAPSPTLPRKREREKARLPILDASPSPTRHLGQR